ncbi:hypothetical protein ACOMHN_047687 [Nucella lapillus]
MSVARVPDMSTEAEQQILSQITDSSGPYHQGHGESTQSLPHDPTPPPLPFPPLPRFTPTHTSLSPPSSQGSIPQSDNDSSSKDLHDHLFPISSALNALQDGTASGSASSWGSPSRPSPLPPSSSLLGVSADNGVPVLTKTEPNDFQIKNELLDRLKQEYFGASTTPTKEDQLRGLLMMTSVKTLADDTASKTLLELAGQSVDLKIHDAGFLAADSAASQSSVTSQSSVPDSSICLPGQASASSFSTGFLGEAKKEEVEEDSTRFKKVRHKKRVNGNKICLVCGDKALAHNFDVITCESCKAFFRRNALKSQSLQRCMFQNNCTIDKNTRRFCPSCRLKKCFDIGMKADLMLDEEERRLRREKKAQRIRQQAASSSSTATEDSSDFLVDSSNIVDPSTASFSPETSSTTSTTITTSTHPNPSFPSSELPQQTPVSSLQPALPSFHTMRNPLEQPTSAGQSSPYSQGSTLGVSPGISHSQPTSAETSPFSSLMTNLSACSPVSFATGLSAAQHVASQALAQSAEAGLALGSGHGTLSCVESEKNQQLGSEEAQQHSQAEASVSPFLESPLTSGNVPHPLLGLAARIFKHVPRDQLPSDPFMYWIVSSEERLMLANLTNAYQEVLLNLPERSLCRNMPLSDSYFIHDFLNEIDDAMYKIVQFSKHIADFRQMRKEDQIAMLKSSAMHTFGIACCAVYVHERDCWLSLRGDLTSSHLRKLTNDDPYIQVGVEYCRSVKSLVKNDFTIYALIHCMILFDPRDAKIVDRQAINQTRDKYVIMLKHYLESQYSYLYADGYFVAIQERVREIIHLAKTGNAMFKRYSSAFQPLITEMLSST